MAHVAAKLKPVDGGFLRGVLYDLGGYPGAVPDANATGRIYGTVMQLPDDPDLLRALDAYEEIDPLAPQASEYVRELREVELAAGGTLECWFYHYNGPANEAQVIATGVWLKRQRGVLADS